MREGLSKLASGNHIVVAIVLCYCRRLLSTGHYHTALTQLCGQVSEGRVTQHHLPCTQALGDDPFICGLILAMDHTNVSVLRE